jgi:hypothetical protein
MQAIQGDRRPAIWPWLVMPLITFSLFYWLYSLDQVGGTKAYGSAPAAATSAHTPAADSDNP